MLTDAQVEQLKEGTLEVLPSIHYDATGYPNAVKPIADTYEDNATFNPDGTVTENIVTNPTPVGTTADWKFSGKVPTDLAPGKYNVVYVYDIGYSVVDNATVINTAVGKNVVIETAYNTPVVTNYTSS